jgi:hypothetical protein
MTRREFLNTVGGTTAVSMAVPSRASALLTDSPAGITSLYVKGLVMVDVGNPELIRLGFPKAPGHRATLSFVPKNGTKQTILIKGHGAIEAKPIVSGSPRIVLPEVIQMKELYGDDVQSRVDRCPSTISIPRNTIHSMATTELTAARYTFVRADTGEEIPRFRPRQLADAITIELSSLGTLKLDDGKVKIPLDRTRDLRVEYVPDRVTPADAFSDHFHYYFPYIERPAALDFDVVPKKVGAPGVPAPHLGHHFMMLDNVAVCSLIMVPGW